MNEKMLFLGRSRDIYKAGSHHNYVRLADAYSESFDYIDSVTNRLLDLNQLLDSYKKVILSNQAHIKYPFKIPFSLMIKHKRFMLFTRNFDIVSYTNSITNGFSIYKNIKGFKYFFPTITTRYNEFNCTEPTEECYGYYYRPQTPDSFHYFCDKINELRRRVKIYFCGRRPDIEKLKGVIPLAECSHTYDMNVFFSNITHYVMPMSMDYVDPLPHVLMEAVQHGKQIICPPLPGRNHSDGIDDVLSLIQYHIDLHDTRLFDNSNTMIDIKKFDAFYKKCISLDMEYSFNREKYQSFYDWCVHEL